MRTKLEEAGFIRAWDDPIYWGSRKRYATEAEFAAAVCAEVDEERPSAVLAERVTMTYLRPCIGDCNHEGGGEPHYHPCGTPGRRLHPCWELDLGGR